MTDHPTAASTPWLTVAEAADRARCGVKLIYREVGQSGSEPRARAAVASSASAPSGSTSG